MRKIGVVVGLLLVLALSAIPASAITWGELDTEHTNVGAMVVDYPDYGPWQWCTGTLIHPQVFLTAGHCTGDLAEYDISRVWVNFDQYAVNEETLLEVAEVITHPDYEWGGSNPHDVGLLVLAEPVEDIAPAALPEEGFLDALKTEGALRVKSEGAKFVVVGYGGSLEWPPPDIFYDDYRQFALSEYLSLTPVWLHMSQLSLKDDGGTCFGDSGGPAFWVEPDGSEVLVGLTSWGDGQCITSAFDYRVDIPDALDFIGSVLDEVSPAKGPKH
jgi:hypothetical protein